MTVDEKNNILAVASENGNIKRIGDVTNIHKKINQKLNLEYLFLFSVALLWCIISFLLLYFFFTFVIKARSVIKIGPLIELFVSFLYPVVVLVDYVTKKKLIEHNNYECYIGKIDWISENMRAHKVHGISQNLFFIGLSKVQKNTHVGDEVVLLSLDDEIYLLNYEILQN